MDFSVRSSTKELLDQDDIPHQDIEQNMRELNIINTWLGGHAITLSGLKKMVGKEKKISICEVGCGGGDNLKAIAKWCAKKNIEVELIGIDINPFCIDFAKSQFQIPNVQFLLSDYRLVRFDDKKPDIIFSSLFCHHFTNPELIDMLPWMKKNARLGFFINDLHRHPLAYYSIYWITKLFSKSYLVKNDAPISVLRGFKRTEWENIFRSANISNYRLQWKWAFRWLLVYKNNN